MRDRQKISTLWRAMTALGLLMLLSACGGNYQAPVSEQGEQQRISAAIIVDSNTPERSLRTPAGRAATVSSSSASVSSSAGAGSSSSQPGSSAVASHRVRPGETLFSIAFQHDLDFRSLAIANGLNPPYTIFVDQVLNLTLTGNSNTRAGSSVANSRIGSAVSNTSGARSQASNANSGRVLRQPVNSSSAANPRWSWPHQGRLLRGFQTGINKGLDIGGIRGDAVLAAADGDVVYSGSDVLGSGDLIIIRHNDRYLSAYAHNSVMLVDEGSHVRAGEKIAEVGESPNGISMLHFEIRQDGNSIDPARLLPSR